MVSVQGCAKKHTEIKSEPSVNVFNGTISKMLGCIFAPAECKDLQDSTENNKDLLYNRKHGESQFSDQETF